MKNILVYEDNPKRVEWLEATTRRLRPVISWAKTLDEFTQINSWMDEASLIIMDFNLRRTDPLHSGDTAVEVLRTRAPLVLLWSIDSNTTVNMRQVLDLKGYPHLSIPFCYGDRVEVAVLKALSIPT